MLQTYPVCEVIAGGEVMTYSVKLTVWLVAELVQSNIKEVGTCNMAQQHALNMSLCKWGEHHTVVRTSATK